MTKQTTTPHLYTGKEKIMSSNNKPIKIDKKVNYAFGKTIYLLGKDKYGDFIWLEAPSWDCDHYWGFGYIERYTNNRSPQNSRDISSHTHWNSEIVGKHEYYDTEKECFRLNKDYIHHLNDNPDITETVLTETESWKLAELMKSFYKLKEIKELFASGSAHIARNPLKKLLTNKRTANRIDKVLLPAIFKEIETMLTPKDG